MSYENFMKAKQLLAQRQSQSGPVGNLETVGSLQRRVLSVHQLDAVAQIQDALNAIAKMEAAVNKLATLYALPVRRLMLHQPGMLAHDIEGLLFEHVRAYERLSKGGVPLDAPATPRPSRSTVEGIAA